MIGVKLEVSGINEIINVLGRYEAELPGCISRAINRSLEMAKTEQIRKTMEIYYVKRNKLSSTINVFKSTKSSLKGEITSGGRPIGMDHFLLNPKTRPKSGRKMVTGAIKRDGIKIDRNTGATEKGGKFDYDILPPATEFEFVMELDNVEDYQLDLVKLALNSVYYC